MFLYNVLFEKLSAGGHRELLVGCKLCCCLVDSAAGVVGSVDPAVDVGAVRLQFLVSAVTCWQVLLLFD